MNDKDCIDIVTTNGEEFKNVRVTFRFAAVGDITSKGAVLESGATDLTINGKALALVNGLVFCPECQTYGVIEKADHHIFKCNKNYWALAHDKISCQCDDHFVLVPEERQAYYRLMDVETVNASIYFNIKDVQSPTGDVVLSRTDGGIIKKVTYH